MKTRAEQFADFIKEEYLSEAVFEGGAKNVEELIQNFDPSSLESINVVIDAIKNNPEWTQKFKEALSEVFKEVHNEDIDFTNDTGVFTKPTIQQEHKIKAIEKLRDALTQYDEDHPNPEDAAAEAVYRSDTGETGPEW